MAVIAAPIMRRAGACRTVKRRVRRNPYACGARPSGGHQQPDPLQLAEEREAQFARAGFGTGDHVDADGTPEFFLAVLESPGIPNGG